jgi:hypothetical protein
MIKKILILSIPILLGLVIAGFAVAAPAQASKLEQGPVIPEHDGPPPGSDAYGVINSFPNHLVGAWNIDNVVYTATQRTWFYMYGGPFYTGACVHVRYDPNSFTASVIETAYPDKCSATASQYFYGLIESVPASYTPTLASSPGVTATWTISGVDFISTPRTYFDTHNGPLEVGACAGVKYRQINGQNIASLIRSEEMYHCLGPVSFNQAFGYVDTFPPDLKGTWIISDTAGMSLTFMTTDATQIYTHGVTIDTGTCVYVKYYTDQGVNYAVTLKTPDDHEQDACKNFPLSFQPPSKIYATVDSMPTTGISGTWTLAGVDFNANQDTRVEEEDGPLTVGNCAEGLYNPANGAMLFRKLESEEKEDCQARDGSQRFRVYGVVEVLPSDGITGTWQVSGVSFQANSTTTVELRHGDLAMGAYVRVNFAYNPNTGERTAQSITTYVAPGFGRIFFHGRYGGFIHKPDGDQLIVDGKTINADPNIDMPAGIQNGSLVYVNAYQDPTGTFATQVTLDQQVFLPFIHP